VGKPRANRYHFQQRPLGASLKPIVHRSFVTGYRASAVLAAGFVALASCQSVAPLPTTTQPTPSQSRPERPASRLPGAPALWGFSAPWDSRSDSSVRAATTKLDAIVTGWIQLDSATSLPSLRYPDDSTRNRGGAQRLTLVTTWHGERFHPETVRRLGADAAALALTASRVGALVAAGDYRGVVLDLEDQTPADLPLTVRVASAIADSAKAHGAAFVAIALPAADTAGYPTRAFIPAVDLAIIMLYDEHWSTSAPGPVATPEWVRRTLAQRLADVGASRVIAALPLYGYLWRTNQPAQPVSFADARRAAFEANVELVRDPASLSLHAIQPGSWELWMSDAHLLRALRAEVNSLGVSRIALWRLGLEDPGVWSVFER
jgi:spore germination protein YaaH